MSSSDASSGDETPRNMSIALGIGIFFAIPFRLVDFASWLFDPESGNIFRVAGFHVLCSTK